MANGNPAPGRRVIDLDKARTARAEKHGDPIEVLFGGEKFTLPHEMPFDFADHASNGDLRAAMAALLGDEQAAAFFALRPSLADYETLVDQAGDFYGAPVGDSPASSSS